MSLISVLIEIASQRFPRLSSRVLASSGYTRDLSRFGGPESFSVWSDATAQRQDRAWQPLVAAAKAGNPREDIAALWSALDDIESGFSTLLEVGCGGGYNSEVIASRFPAPDYFGVDIAPAMVSIAHEHYPQRSFAVASAYELPFSDGSFEVVVDGVALIHMPEWRTSLSEYARVASKAVVLHGVTLAESEPTSVFAKLAYGQPSMEFIFNRSELLGACAERGLVFEHSYPNLDYDLAGYLGIPTVSETWTLRVETQSAT